MDNYILSVRPEWLAKILNREKTIELRKTAPQTPCVMLLYCTKLPNVLIDFKEYVTETNHTRYILCDYLKKHSKQINGKIVGKFTLKNVETVSERWTGNEYIFDDEKTLNMACISACELEQYQTKRNPIFAWHISDLVIFDEPKELAEFGVKRAPQSYMKVKGV